MPQKRSQPVSTNPPPSKKHSKSSKAKANNTPSSSAEADASNSPPTPALTPSSSSTPPSSLSLARSSKKLTKAIRPGHHHGNGGHGGHSASGTKGTMKTKRGPEAELSGEDDDDPADEDDDGVSIVDEKVVIGEPSAGKSVPQTEVSMHALLDGARLRPEPQNISRGYELLTSPASRLVIPFDAVPSSPKKPFATRTNGGAIFGGAGYGGVCSIPSSPGFSDDLEWEWEDLCFEMDGVDLVTTTTATTTATTTKGKKDAYAEVVKRAAV